MCKAILKATLALMAALAVLVFVVNSLEHFKDCIHNHKNHEAYRALHENLSVSVKTVVRLQLNTACGMEAVHKNEGAFTLVFTFLVALFTATLWQTTKRLVIGAELTAERQLRAYVHIAIRQESRIEIRGNVILPVNLRIKNAGQTPAYKMVIASQVDVAPFPSPGNLPAPTFDKAKGSETSIHSRQFLWMTSESKNPITDEQISHLLTGVFRVYVHGFINYIDVFDCERTAHFRLVATEPGTGPTGLSYCREGNYDT